MILAAQLGIAAVLMSPAGAFGWGDVGHEVLCQIAWRETTDAGRALVKQTLGTQDAAGFGVSCTWPDTVREEPGHLWAKPQHYVNVPRGQALDPQKDCPNKGCAIRAIGQQSRLVVDSHTPPQQRAEALKFLAHFVGDLHEPLHVSYPQDGGGNGIQVKFCPKACSASSITNLHTVWDAGIIEAGAPPVDAFASQLQLAITDSDRAAWKNADVVTWAQESYDLAKDHAYRQVKNGKIKTGYIGNLPQPVLLGSDYVSLMRPVSLQQLQKGGVRLAAVLDMLAQGTVPSSLTVVPPRFVTPSSTVSSHTTTVHESASTSSASLGTVAVGQRAELLGQEPKGWYFVRLDDGTEGYVESKSVGVVSA